MLVGLFDLIFEHPGGQVTAPFVATYLKETIDLAVYRYLVFAIVAKRDEFWLSLLHDAANDEHEGSKLEILIDALSLIERRPGTQTLLGTLLGRLRSWDRSK